MSVPLLPEASQQLNHIALFALSQNSPPHNNLFVKKKVNNVSNSKVLIHLKDKIYAVTCLMGLPPGAATE